MKICYKLSSLYFGTNKKAKKLYKKESLGIIEDLSQVKVLAKQKIILVC